MSETRSGYENAVAEAPPPWVSLFGDDRPDALAAPWEVSRRRRLMLAISMVLIVPLGIVALGAALNAALALGAANSFAQKDYLGSASWSRWNVSLNPLDSFTPHFNLGTAYTKAGALGDGRTELTTALGAARGPAEQCPARANLALTYEKLGDRATKADDTDTAATDYQRARSLWQRSASDQCGQDQKFTDSADSAERRLDEKQQQNQQQQQQQQQDGQQGQGQQGQGQSGQGQSGQGQSGQGDQQGQGGSQSDQQGQGGSQGDQQGQGQNGSQGDQQGQGQNGSQGDQQGQNGSQGDQQGQGGSQSGQGQSGSQGDQQGGTIGEGSRDTSRSLGDKLGSLQSRDEQATRSRDQGGARYSSGASKPW